MLSFISIGAFPINIGTFALKFEALVINEKKIYFFFSRAGRKSCYKISMMSNGNINFY